MCNFANVLICNYLYRYVRRMSYVHMLTDGYRMSHTQLSRGLVALTIEKFIVIVNHGWFGDILK